MSRHQVLSVVLCSTAFLLPATAARGGERTPPAAVPAGLGAADWSGLRTAWEAGRHAVRAIDGGYRARNPGQHWVTVFDGRGATTVPDSGDWSWGLQLAAYGRAGVEQVVTTPVSVTADGQGVGYRWGALLGEWYRNDVRGLEHGFTLHARPAGPAGELWLDLAVRGALRPVLAADGRDVRFVDAAGACVLTYTGLAVSDADGRHAAARFELAPAGLRLVVDDTGALYPLTIDPVAQQAYLKAGNTGTDDEFGESVAVSGDTAVVGAWGEESAAIGVNGDGSNNSLSYAGAAYVFVRSGGTWSQQAYLKASNTEAEDDFGYSVAISGDTIVVGAYGEDGSASGVNGNQSSNGTQDAGAAYVFVRSGTSWSQQAYLKASNPGSSDQFGRSVAISGDTVLVGAWFEDSNETGTGGSGANDAAAESGAAYVFVRSGTNWSQQAYLKASNTGAGDRFGYTVALSGETALVGAYGEDSNATGVNGNEASNATGDSGAAYVFVRGGGAWSQQAYLKAVNPGVGDWFGTSLALSGDTAVVGAYREDSNAVGVDGDHTNNSATDAGAAYVFARSGTNWSQQAYLKASNTWTTDWFGYSTAVEGDTVVVGATQEDSSAAGVDGDQSNNGAVNSGAAYVFTRSGTSWSQKSYLKASNTGMNDLFGYSVAVSGGTLVVGALYEDSNAIGVNGDGNNDGASDSGAAYAFELGLGPWTNLGFALAGTLGAPSLAGTGSLVAGSPGTLNLSGARHSALADLFVSLSSTPAAFKGGTLVPIPPVLTLVVVTSPTGTVPLAWSGWPTGLSGLSLYFQYAIQDPGGPKGVALSNALRATPP